MKPTSDTLPNSVAPTQGLSFDELLLVAAEAGEK